MSQSLSPVRQQHEQERVSLSKDSDEPKTKRQRLNSDSPTPSEDRFSPEIGVYNTSAPDEDDEDDLPQTTESSKSKKPKHPLSRNKVAESREAIAKTGVIYLSRIPPRLNPTKIRQLLSIFRSPVLRIFLAPETTTAYQRRVKAGGSKRKQFTEGWVEFEDKKVAKKVATMLNAERIGGKKGDFCYDDLWCIKYLPKFKWHHLTEQIAYKNASRAEKLRNEIAQERRENASFLQNTERSKAIRNMEKKRAEKGIKDTDNEVKVRRQFAQRTVVDKSQKIAGMARISSSDILSKVFD